MRSASLTGPLGGPALGGGGKEADEAVEEEEEEGAVGWLLLGGCACLD